jgi:hypothetical protein
MVKSLLQTISLLSILISSIKSENDTEVISSIYNNNTNQTTTTTTTINSINNNDQNDNLYMSCLTEDWILINNKCYLISNNATDWNSALSICKNYTQYTDDIGDTFSDINNRTVLISSNLIYLENRKDYNALVDLRMRSDDDLWIGLQTYNIPLNWTWMNDNFFNVKHPWLVVRLNFVAKK